ncbi:MAG TPA: hypothetical protein DCX53_06760 [Anaerolineae bacterium]|nr:hypothetical protein [Anaerolineae bacterium]
MTRQAGIWLLVVRILLFEIAASLDCSSFAIFLYILLPFLAYMFINKWAAITLGVIFTTWVGIKFGFFRCPDCPIDQNITPVLITGVAMIWSNAMGGLVKGVEISRAKTKQLFADLERSHQKLKEYAARVEDLAAAEERNRVARDIHDSVGHSLAVVNVQLEKALVFQQRDADVTEQAIKDARRAAREALGDVRESVRTLRKSVEAFSLTERLHTLAGRSGSESIKLDLQVEGSEEGFSKPALMTLYRTAQEALTNVYKHANATRVIISAHLGDGSAQLRVQDNGDGFEVTSVLDSSFHRQGHYGLQGIRERLELVGGELSLKSRPNVGTTLTVTIPKKRLTEPPGAKPYDE